MTVTLITGANKGIGYKTVRQLIALGHTVCLGARDEEPGKAAADTLGARFVQLDVRDDASVAHAAATVSSSEEHHDVLINNAGIAPHPVRTRLRRSSRGGRAPAFDAAAYKQRNVVEPASSASTALLLPGAANATSSGAEPSTPPQSGPRTATDNKMQQDSAGLDGT